MSDFFTRARVWALVVLCAYAPLASSQTVELVTGQGRFVDIPGTTVGFQPGAMAITPDGYLYTNDINGKLLRLNTATGAVTALPATPGGLNYDLGWSWGIAVDLTGHAHVTSQGGLHRINSDGTLTRMRDLGYTGPMAFGADGTIYMVPGDNRVYAHRPGGAVEVIAGAEQAGFAGDGGPAVNALLSYPQGIAVGSDGNVYVSDTDNNRIRKIDVITGVISTFAGTGGVGYSGDGIPAALTDIGQPLGVAFDATGNLYVGTHGAGRIVRIDVVSNTVSTIAGGNGLMMSGDGSPALSAGIGLPRFVAVDASGNVFFSDGDSYTYIRKVDVGTGIVSRVLGFPSFYFCGEGVPANQGCLAQPLGVDVDRSSGVVVVNDAALTRLRRISGNTVSTFATLTETPSGIDHDQAGNVYVMGGNKVTRYDRLTGAATVVAGGNGPGFSGDGGPATAARMGSLGDVAVDTSGNVYISDTSNFRIRKVTASTGIITSVQTFTAGPSTIEISPLGEIYVSEGCRIHRINSTNYTLIQTLGTGTCATQDPAGNSPTGTTNLGSTRAFTFDAQGHMYLSWSNQIYRVLSQSSTLLLIRRPPQGWVTAEGVKFDRPNGMSFDAAGRLYISQENRPYLFRMTGLKDNTAPVVTVTVVGLKGVGNWYRTDVQVSFTVTDPESYAVITSGCQGGSVTTDTLDGFSIPFECQATSLGGSISRGESIRRDTIMPRVTWGTPNPAPDAGGWNYANVSIPFTIWESPSGLQSSSAPSPLVISGEGTGLTRPVTLTDFAGNTATYTSPPVNITRAAVIQEQLSGTLGGNGWYRSDIQVSWNITAAPIITSTTGCGTTVVSTDTAGTTLTCTVTTPNGTVTKSVTVKRDATSPTLSFGARAPLPNADGWNGSVVNMPFTATDALSGVGSATPASPLVFNQAGAGQSRQVEVTDIAGNVATFQSPSVNIDLSPPAIDATVSGPPGNNGWYRGEVNVHFTVSSPLSPVRTSGGCLDARVNVDTTGRTYSCLATNAAGSTTKAVTFKIDQTPPTVAFGARSPLPGADGWNNVTVNVPYTTADAMSGVATATPASPLVFDQSGAAQSTQVQVVDLAGNTTTVQSPLVNIDQSPPTITVDIAGTSGNDGWYRGNVNVDWTVASTSPAQTTGCADTAVFSDTAGVTFTCTATSAGGSATKSVTLKRDATPPRLTFGAASPAADDAGWSSAPVSLPFDASDALSGVKSTSSQSPLSIAQPGASVSLQVVVEDLAGNLATFNTPPLKIDETPPDVTYFIYGTQSGNNSGWYRTDARVVFSGIDAQGSLVSRTGECDVTLTTDSPGTTYTCTATSAGGSATKSVTIKRDTTPPTLTWGTPFPDANAIGWHTTDVSFPFTLNDATSGAYGTSQGDMGPVIVRSTGPGVGSQITAWDVAGNQSTYFTPLVNIDRSPPAVGPMVTGTPGPHGWYTSDAQVAWQILKIPAESLLSRSGCEGGTVTTDTAGVTFTCSATSGAGTNTQSITIRRDTTPPAITFGTPSPAPNANGWNRTNVLIPFTISEPMSGIDIWSHDSPLLLGTEGAGVTEQVMVKDLAGNITTVTTPPRNIDKTAPVVTVTSPANGATYGFYQDLVANYSCADVSPTTCTGPNANGDLVNTKTAGARTFKVTGKDAVAFTTSVTNSFTVAGTFDWEGFLPNVVLPPAANLVPKQQLVPVRWKLPDGNGGHVTNAASYTSATVQTVSCTGLTSVPLNDPAAGPSGLGFDSSSNVFTYNWQSGNWTGCRRLIIKLKDNSQHELLFRFQ